MYFTIHQQMADTFDTKINESLFETIDHVANRVTNFRQKTDEHPNTYPYTIGSTENSTLAQILLDRAHNPTTEQTNATLHITDVGLWI